MVLEDGNIVRFHVQKDIPYLRASDRFCAPFVPSCPVTVPRPKPNVSCAPSVAVEPTSLLDGASPQVGDAGQDGIGEADDEREAVPLGVDSAAEAKSLEHMLTHRFKNLDCPSCARCKIRQRPCRRVFEKADLDK